MFFFNNVFWFFSVSTSAQPLHRGDLGAAKAQIASAFLLDDRCVNCWMSKDPLPCDAPCLEYALLVQLIESDDEDTLADDVMKVIFAFTGFSSVMGHSQELVYIQVIETNLLSHTVVQCAAQSASHL